jgi:hypothetical protein
MLSFLKKQNNLPTNLQERSNVYTPKTALDALAAEIGGKLIYVRALESLPEDGILRGESQSKGIYIGKKNSYLNYDKKSGQYGEVIMWNIRTTVHFSLNQHVNHNDFLERPFVVLIPANSDLLLQTTSISFSETIIIGNYKLPADSVIMVRKTRRDDLPNYYKKFSIIEFDDSDENEKPNLDKKRQAVDNVVKMLGGPDIKMEEVAESFWPSLKVIDRSGRNINTPEQFKKLFGMHPVSFGSHEYTRLDAQGEQWRDFFCSASSTIFIASDLRGDVGFSMEMYHSEKLNNWLKELGIPNNLLQYHLNINKYSLIVFRAMDFIFHHFREKRLANAYISSHIKKHLNELEKSGLFKVKTGLFDSELFEKNTVDELAKMICDYEKLIQQERGVTFDLITLEQIAERLMSNLISMHPIEAQIFLEKYFKESSLVAFFPAEEYLTILKKLKNLYVIFYSSHCFVPQQMFERYAPILNQMLTPSLQLGPEDTEWAREAFYLLCNTSVITQELPVESNKVDDLEEEDEDIMPWYEFVCKNLQDKIVARLSKYSAKPDFKSICSMYEDLGNVCMGNEESVLFKPRALLFNEKGTFPQWTDLDKIMSATPTRWQENQEQENKNVYIVSNFKRQPF